MAPLAILLIIAFPVCGLIGYYIKTKNRERMKLIEQGINPDEGLNISEYRKQSYLKNGVLFLSLGIGLLVAYILNISLDLADKFMAYLTIIVIFGGIGFIINYIILKRWDA